MNKCVSEIFSNIYPHIINKHGYTAQMTCHEQLFRPSAGINSLLEDLGRSAHYFLFAYTKRQMTVRVISEASRPFGWWRSAFSAVITVAADRSDKRFQLPASKELAMSTDTSVFAACELQKAQTTPLNCSAALTLMPCNVWDLYI